MIAAITSDRQLDRVNAHTNSLGIDFARFGVSDWWRALEAHDSRTRDRRVHLERLNKARNAIAHANQGPLAALAADGYPVNLKTFNTWRSALTGLASTMDAVLADRLGRIFDRPRRW